MHFAKLFVMGALAAIAYAQDKLQITGGPTAAVGGKTYTIKWSGGDATAPVTLVLREGPSGNSKVLSTITESATGGEYQWAVPSSLVTNNDYAIQITQGTQSNYWALSIAGSGTPTSSETTASSTKSSSSESSSSTSESSTTSSSSSTITSASNSTVTTHKPTRTSSSSESESTSSTSSSAPSETSSAPNDNSGASLKSNAALVLGAIAAIAYLG